MGTGASPPPGSSQEPRNENIPSKKKGFSPSFDLVQQNCASESRKSIIRHSCLQPSSEDALSPHYLQEYALKRVSFNFSPSKLCSPCSRALVQGRSCCSGWLQIRADGFCLNNFSGQIS